MTSVSGAFPGLPFQTSFYRAHRPVFRLPACYADGLQSLPKADVLVVLAHPDDEIFMSGTLAKLATSGYKVQTVYLTSGDAGKDRTRKINNLAQRREAEQRTALKKLGIKQPPVFLRHPDGRLGHDIDPSQELRTILEKTRPQLILTFGPDGITGHPDHVVTSHLVDTLAQNESVYHMALSREAMRAFPDTLKALPGWNVQRAASPVDVRIEVQDMIHKKNRAMQAHRSQYDSRETEALKAFYLSHPVEEFVSPKLH